MHLTQIDLDTAPVGITDDNLLTFLQFLGSLHACCRALVMYDDCQYLWHFFDIDKPSIPYYVDGSVCFLKVF